MAEFLLNRHYREWIWIAGENGKPGVTADLVVAPDGGTTPTGQITDPLVEVAGDNMVSANVTLNAEGGIDLTTVGADNDQWILIPHETANANQLHPDNFTYRTDRELEFECALKIPSTITTLSMMAGLKTDDSPVDLLLTDTGLVCFNFNTDDSDTTWGVVSDIAAGSGDLDVNTGVTVVAGDVVHFAIKFDSNQIAHCFINGQEVTSVNFSGGVDLQIPFIGFQSLDDTPSSTAACTVYGWRVSRLIGQAR